MTKANLRHHIGARLRHIHRRVGILAALFLFWMSISGLFINLEDHYELTDKKINWSWLMNWYGLKPEAAPQSGFITTGHWIIALQNGIYFDGTALPNTKMELIGASETKTAIFLATTESLLMINGQGQLIDRLSTSALPIRNIEKIGTIDAETKNESESETKIVIRQSNKLFSTLDGENWQPIAENTSGKTLHWSQPEKLSESQQHRVSELNRPSLPVSRVIADLHSGRIFGSIGTYIVNLVGIATCLLSVTGLWLYARIRRIRK